MNIKIDYDEQTDVLFVDFVDILSTESVPTDTIGNGDVLCHVSLNTKEVVGFRIVNWTRVFPPPYMVNGNYFEHIRRTSLRSLAWFKFKALFGM